MLDAKYEKKSAYPVRFASEMELPALELRECL
jgi:hypothetical protein